MSSYFMPELLLMNSKIISNGGRVLNFVAKSEKF